MFNISLNLLIKLLLNINCILPASFIHNCDKKNLKYLIAGISFGFILIKGEVISWFRIQEMFRLQSFHMFGVIGSAVVVGAISVFLIKKVFYFEFCY